MKRPKKRRLYVVKETDQRSPYYFLYECPIMARKDADKSYLGDSKTAVWSFCALEFERLVGPLPEGYVLAIDVVPLWMESRAEF